MGKRYYGLSRGLDTSHKLALGINLLTDRLAHTAPTSASRGTREGIVSAIRRLSFRLARTK